MASSALAMDGSAFFTALDPFASSALMMCAISSADFVSRLAEERFCCSVARRPRDAASILEDVLEAFGAGPILLMYLTVVRFRLRPRFRDKSSSNHSPQ